MCLIVGIKVQPVVQYTEDGTNGTRREVFEIAGWMYNLPVVKDANISLREVVSHPFNLIRFCNPIQYDVKSHVFKVGKTYIFGDRRWDKTYLDVSPAIIAKISERVRQAALDLGVPGDVDTVVVVDSVVLDA